MASRAASEQTKSFATGRLSFGDRRFWIRVGIGLVALFVFAALYDEAISRALTGWPDHERWFFAKLTRLGEADWILIPALVLAVSGFLIRGLHLTYTSRWTAISAAGLGWYVFIGVGAPSLASTFLKQVFGRARPVHLDEMGPLFFHPFQFDWSLASFPSGHATTAFAFAVTLTALLGPRWRWPLFIFATMIALSRIVIGMHFMTDVVAGAALGTFGAIQVRDWFCARRFPLEIRMGGFRHRCGAPVLRLWTRLRPR